VPLNNVFLDPEDERPNRAKKRSRRRVTSLRPLPGPFVRVPLQWLTKPVKKHIAPSRTRLFFYLLYRSHWGQRGVVVTDQVAAEVGVEASRKRRILTQLAHDGWIRVERRTTNSAPVVWPIVVAA
jgi:hypothetical protein